MDFGFSEEQDLLRATARSLLARLFAPGWSRPLLDAEPAGAAALTPSWAEPARLGWFGIGVAEEDGGGGGDAVDQLVLLEELGRVLAPASYSTTVCGAVPVIAALAPPEQRARLLAPLLSGTHTAALCAGPDGGGVVAREENGRLRLDGRAECVAGGAVASLLVVEARDPRGGVTVCAVPAGTAGLRVTPLQVLDPTAQMARVDFSGVELAGADMLDSGDAGATVDNALDRLAIASVAELCGAGERMLEMTVEHARSREQFGRPIGSFQAVKHMCADMLVRLESSRAAVHYAVLALAESRQDMRCAVSAAKSYAAEAIGLVGEDALQIHGGLGFTWEHDVHLFVRRAASAARLHGSGDLHRERVAAAIGL